MTDGDARRCDLVYGEFECGGERVVRLEDPQRDDAWIRSTAFVPIEP